MFRYRLVKKQVCISTSVSNAAVFGDLARFVYFLYEKMYHVLDKTSVYV